MNTPFFYIIISDENQYRCKWIYKPGIEKRAFVYYLFEELIYYMNVDIFVVDGGRLNEENPAMPNDTPVGHWQRLTCWIAQFSKIVNKVCVFLLPLIMCFFLCFWDRGQEESRRLRQDFFLFCVAYRW